MSKIRKKGREEYSQDLKKWRRGILDYAGGEGKDVILIPMN